jgi:hypothetical protein
VSYVEVKRQRQRQLVAWMHPGFPVEAPTRSHGPVNFDGGVRGDLPPSPPPMPWWIRAGWTPTDDA